MLLEQMRLCLAKKDYIRTQIISRKMSVKFLEENGQEVSVHVLVQLLLLSTLIRPFCLLQDLKLKYYKLMIELDEHDEKFLRVARHYAAIYNTQSIKEKQPDALQVR